jgi:hypothetical protein
MRYRRLMKIIAVFAALRVYGQGHVQSPYERVLVPIIIQTPVPGAFGSLWQTTLTVRNESDQAVEITPTPFGGCLELCEVWGAHTTLQLGANVVNPNGGTFMYVGSPGLRKVTFNLRVQDISRQASTWGTTIPVVRETEVSTGKLQLLNIPVSSDFRTTLRVYDFDTLKQQVGSVQVRVYDMCGIGPLDNTPQFPCSVGPLAEANLELASGGEQLATIPDHPGTAMIGDLVSSFQQLRSVLPRPGDLTAIPRVRIDIDPITPGLRFWGFASVTNNTTQHVTVITPN